MCAACFAVTACYIVLLLAVSLLLLSATELALLIMCLPNC
jgi:hypothetical protein